VKAPHSQRGGTLAETAIILGVAFALIFGIVDFGRALYTYSFVAETARQGARWASVRAASCTVYNPGLDHCPAQTGSTDIQAYVRNLSVGATNANTINADLEYNGSCGAGASGQCVATVTVSYNFAFIAPFVSMATIPMSSTSEMTVWQ
jgi:Flp pilus assembly protein TadG